ncbi:hypothetical protein RF55_7647 [Lasius niger]|uniref:Uncharacterized protein n=1 Tax=Lasius niger TaxID=67767 RepID=A0A0J7KPU2_LASNI|nr:hypothetical protein RF55_7647 [Lasius niger]
MDLLQAFKESIGNLQENKLLQVSMDGPNVNWAFIREYKSKLSSNVKLLDIGSCGLHSLHCAFKNGIYATHWDIISYMRAIYNLFKDVPARRALYTQYSESDVFPLKFCSIRWLENVEVTQRAIDVTPHIKKFVEGVRQDKIEPTCKSFSIVAKFIQDPSLCAKLAFFKSLASDVEPFLREFQSDAPLVPILHSALCQMLKHVLDRFMKPEVIKSVSSITLKDVQTEANLSAKNIVLGFDTLKALKKVNITTANMLQFRQDCKNCFQKFVCKTMNRSPLAYTLTKATTCLDPNLIASNLDLVKKRLNNLCSILIEKDRLTGSAGDTVVRQFREFTSRPARNAYSRYVEYLERYRQQASVAEQEALTKRRKTLEAKELEVKCIRILENAQKEANALEEQIQALKK